MSIALYIMAGITYIWLNLLLFRFLMIEWVDGNRSFLRFKFASDGQVKRFVGACILLFLTGLLIIAGRSVE